MLNLTIPAAHADVALGAHRGGKHVYAEKPLAVTFADGRSIIDGPPRPAYGWAARRTPSWARVPRRRARRSTPALIGRPLSASAVMVTPGHERWHPNPDFYYAAGGGPLLDMGPYYISALVHLLGPVRAVTGAASRCAERVIGSGPRAGERIPVEVDSHVTGVLEHANGALTTITTSFDGVATTAAPIEVHGETGTSPSRSELFRRRGPAVRARRHGWRVLAPSAGYRGGSRGLGLIDARPGRPGGVRPGPAVTSRCTCSRR